MKRRALVTLGSGIQSELLDITRASRQSYANRHNYELIEETHVLAPSRPPAWGKISLLREVAASDIYDSIVWLDADAIIVDETDDIDCNGGGLIEYAIHRYEGHEFPNAGVMVLRRSHQMSRFLDLIWSETSFIDHRWWDNAAMLELLGYTTDGVVRKVSQSIHDSYCSELPLRWNSINQTLDETPAIAHFAGIPHGLRVAVMQILADEPSRVVELLRVPQIALAETS
jgi:hypothetical protein